MKKLLKLFFAVFVLAIVYNTTAYTQIIRDPCAVLCIGGCTSCPNGCSLSNKSCSSCPVDYYCTGYNYGYACPRGSGTGGVTSTSSCCEFCKPGYFIDGSPMCPANCSICPAGSYKAGENKNTSCDECRPGYYCPAGSTSYTGSGLCPAGYYCPHPGTMIACPTGTTSPAGSTSSSRCVCNQSSWDNTSNCYMEGLGFSCSGRTCTLASGRTATTVSMSEIGTSGYYGTFTNNGTISSLRLNGLWANKPQYLSITNNGIIDGIEAIDAILFTGSITNNSRARFWLNNSSIINSTITNSSGAIINGLCIVNGTTLNGNIVNNGTITELSSSSDTNSTAFWLHNCNSKFNGKLINNGTMSATNNYVIKNDCSSVVLKYEGAGNITYGSYAPYSSGGWDITNFNRTPHNFTGGSVTYHDTTVVIQAGYPVITATNAITLTNITLNFKNSSGGSISPGTYIIATKGSGNISQTGITLRNNGSSFPSGSASLSGGGSSNLLLVYSCPAGTYGASCTTCPKGSYCTSGVARSCPAGSYQDLTGQSSCKTCPIGRYCPEGATYEIACPNYQYQDTTGQTSCKSCPSGSWPNGNSHTGNLATACISNSCPANSTQAGLDGYSRYCFCNAGYYAQGEQSFGTTQFRVQPWNTNVCNPCSAGTYSSASSRTCSICPKGSYCPATASAPITCPDGQYQDETGQSSCKACTASPYLPGALIDTCDKSTGFPVTCKVGGCHISGIAYCTPAPVGHYSPGINVGAFDGGVRSNCTICPAGQYQDVIGQSSCKTCPAGGYCPVGATTSTACPSGSTTSGTGSSSISSCTVSSCPANSSLLNGGTINALCVCNQGYNSGDVFPVEHSSTCAVRNCFGGNGEAWDSCPGGGVSVCTNGLGVLHGNDKVGAWCYCNSNLNLIPDGNSGNCKCTAGSYKNGNVCTSCPAGSYQDATGQSSCKTCPAGSYCPVGAISPTICPKGSYCPANTSTPTTCPAGFTTPSTGATSQTDCNVCTLTGWSNGDVCYMSSIGFICSGSACTLSEEKTVDVGLKILSLTDKTLINNGKIKSITGGLLTDNFIIENNNNGIIKGDTAGINLQRIAKIINNGVIEGSDNSMVIGSIENQDIDKEFDYQGNGKLVGQIRLISAAKIKISNYQGKPLDIFGDGSSCASDGCKYSSIKYSGNQQSPTIIKLLEGGDIIKATLNGSVILDGITLNFTNSAGSGPIGLGKYLVASTFDNGTITTTDVKLKNNNGAFPSNATSVLTGGGAENLYLEYNCNAGFYGAIGALTCTQCPTGSSSAAGSKSVSDCSISLCPSNSTLTNSGTLQAQCQCNAGFGGDATTGACVKCLAGNYKEDISNTQCIQCSAGSYVSTEGNTTCILCTKGSYSDKIGAINITTCQLCPAGTTSVEGSPSVESCQQVICQEEENPELIKGIATTKTIFNETCYKKIPATCKANYILENKDKVNAKCSPCPQGSSSVGGEITQCEKLMCANDNASPLNSAQTTTMLDSTCWRTVPTSCNAKYYLTNPNKLIAACQICVAGNYKEDTGTTCSTCDAGSSCKDGEKTICPAGTWSSYGASTCTLCQDGSSSLEGATSSDSCNICAQIYWDNDKNQCYMEGLGFSCTENFCTLPSGKTVSRINMKDKSSPSSYLTLMNNGIISDVGIYWGATIYLNVINNGTMSLGQEESMNFPAFRYWYGNITNTGTITSIWINSFTTLTGNITNERDAIINGFNIENGSSFNGNIINNGVMNEGSSDNGSKYPFGILAGSQFNGKLINNGTINSPNVHPIRNDSNTKGLMYYEGSGDINYGSLAPYSIGGWNITNFNRTPYNFTGGNVTYHDTTVVIQEGQNLITATGGVTLNKVTLNFKNSSGGAISFGKHQIFQGKSSSIRNTGLELKNAGQEFNTTNAILKLLKKDDGDEKTNGLYLNYDCKEGFFRASGDNYDINGQSCQPCPNGYMCSGEEKEPIICPEGATNVGTGNTLCDTFICAAGNYYKDGKCNICEGGYYCSGGNENTRLSCEAGSYCPEGSSTMTICPAGNYCTSTLSEPIKCPAGKYNSREGMKRSTNCVLCSTGYYCPEASVEMTICPVGNYCISGVEIPTLCPESYYQDQVGQSKCLPCAKDTASNDERTECGCKRTDGFEKPENSTCTRTNCSGCISFICDAGYYAQGNSCIPCGANKTSPQGSISETSCYNISCPQGNYLTGTTCTLCSKGTYSAIDGNTDNFCTKCPANTYTDEEGLFECKKCPEGKEAEEGAVACRDPLTERQWCELTGGSWTDCNEGQRLEDGQCKPCIEGTASDVKGNVLPTCPLCTGTTFQDEQGQAKCKQCPSGYISAPDGITCVCDEKNSITVPSNAVCIKGNCSGCTEFSCETGYYRSGDNCLPCGLNQISVFGATSQTQCSFITCQKGQRLIGGKCLPCAKGTYQDTDDNSLSACKLCPMNTYNDQEGSTSAEVCKPCQEGTFSNLGSPLCIEATEDIMCKETTGNWKDCLIGQKLTEGWCRPCDVGTYYPTSKNMNPYCTKCPAGQYQDSTGQGTCKECNQEFGEIPNEESTACICSLTDGIPVPENSTCVKENCSGCTEFSCNENYYKQSNICVLCPENITVPENATGITGVCERITDFTCNEGSQKSEDGKSCVCDKGYWLKDGKCALCPKGTYKDKNGNELCTICPEGFTNTTEGSTECLSKRCPKGQTRTTGGSLGREYVGDLVQSTQCIWCYGDQCTGSSKVTCCIDHGEQQGTLEPARYCAPTGQGFNDCKKIPYSCTKWYKLVNGTTRDAECQQCPNGYMNPTGLSSSCDEKIYCENNIISAQELNAKTTKDILNNNSCFKTIPEVCLKGYLLKKKDTLDATCQPCPDGTTTSGDGGTTCGICLLDAWSDAGNCYMESLGFTCSGKECNLSKGANVDKDVQISEITSKIMRVDGIQPVLTNDGAIKSIIKESNVNSNFDTVNKGTIKGNMLFWGTKVNTTKGNVINTGSIGTLNAQALQGNIINTGTINNIQYTPNFTGHIENNGTIEQSFGESISGQGEKFADSDGLTDYRGSGIVQGDMYSNIGYKVSSYTGQPLPITVPANSLETKIVYDNSAGPTTLDIRAGGVAGQPCIINAKGGKVCRIIDNGANTVELKNITLNFKNEAGTGPIALGKHLISANSNVIHTGLILQNNNSALWPEGTVQRLVSGSLYLEYTCAQGYYASADKLSCVKCEAGYFCTGEQEPKTLCPDDLYQDQTGQTSCKECDKEKGEVPSEDKASCLCSLTDGIPTPENSTCAKENCSGCTEFNCNENHYKQENTCVLCPASITVPENATGSTQNPCKENEFTEFSCNEDYIKQGDACVLCPASITVPENATGSTINACDPTGFTDFTCNEFYEKTVDGLSCKEKLCSNEIPEHSSSTKTIKDQFNKCFKIIPTTCQAGAVISNKEALTALCTTCLAGSYSEGNLQETCTLCPENTYSQTPKAADISTCISCPSGKHSPSGSSSITDCREFICEENPIPDNAIATTTILSDDCYITIPTECIPDYVISNANTVNAICVKDVCEIGQRLLNRGETTASCQPCEVGTSSNQKNSESVCSPCADGSFQNEVGKTQCQPCTLNSSSSSDKTTCNCNADFVSKDGKCISCGPNEEPNETQDTCVCISSAYLQNGVCKICPDAVIPPADFVKDLIYSPCDATVIIDFTCLETYEKSKDGNACQKKYCEITKDINGLTFEDKVFLPETCWTTIPSTCKADYILQNAGLKTAKCEKCPVTIIVPENATGKDASMCDETKFTDFTCNKTYTKENTTCKCTGNTKELTLEGQKGCWTKIGTPDAMADETVKTIASKENYTYTEEIVSCKNGYQIREDEKKVKSCICPEFIFEKKCDISTGCKKTETLPNGETTYYKNIGVKCYARTSESVDAMFKTTDKIINDYTYEEVKAGCELGFQFENNKCVCDTSKELKLTNPKEPHNKYTSTTYIKEGPVCYKNITIAIQLQYRDSEDNLKAKDGNFNLADIPSACWYGYTLRNARSVNAYCDLQASCPEGQFLEAGDCVCLHGIKDPLDENDKNCYTLEKKYNTSTESYVRKIETPKGLVPDWDYIKNGNIITQVPKSCVPEKVLCQWDCKQDAPLNCGAEPIVCKLDKYNKLIPEWNGKQWIPKRGYTENQDTACVTTCNELVAPKMPAHICKEVIPTPANSGSNTSNNVTTGVVPKNPNRITSSLSGKTPQIKSPTIKLKNRVNPIKMPSKISSAKKQAPKIKTSVRSVKSGIVPQQVKSGVSVRPNVPNASRPVVKPVTRPNIKPSQPKMSSSNTRPGMTKPSSKTSSSSARAGSTPRPKNIVVRTMKRAQ